MTAALQTAISTPLMTSRPPHTPEDVLDMEDEGLFELVEGRLVEKHLSLLANKVAGLIALEVGMWARGGKAHVFPEQTFQCFPGEPTRIRRPDIAVILVERFAEGILPEGHCKIRPDVAIEVVSPNDLVYDLAQKLEDYESAGIPLVWVVNPDVRTVEIRRPGGVARVLSKKDQLTGDDVLPGFSVSVSDLFPALAAKTA